MTDLILKLGETREGGVLQNLMWLLTGNARVKIVVLRGLKRARRPVLSLGIDVTTGAVLVMCAL